MPSTKYPPNSMLRINAQLADLLDAMATATPTIEPVAIGVVWRDAGVLTVSVGIPPVITLQPVTQTVAAGLQATFTVTATNATSYQWELNDGSGYASIVGATAAGYTTPVLLEADDGNLYRCVVTGPGGTVTSNAATLTVPVIATVPVGFNWTPPFTVYKTAGVYSTDYDPEDSVPITSTTYWVDVATGSDANPGTEISPFKSIYKAVHNRAANVLVYVKPGDYRYTNSIAGWNGAVAGTNVATAYNVVVRRWGISGRIRSITDVAATWVLDSGNTYKTTVSGSTSYLVADLKTLDAHSNGTRLTVQTSIANVNANPGSMYYDSGTTTVYVRTLDSRAPDSDIELLSGSIRNGNYVGRGTCWFEYMDFIGGSYPFYSTNTAGLHRIYGNNSTFKYGNQTAGGCQVEGGAEAIFITCDASVNANDGFKYVVSGGFVAKYAELECTGWGNGTVTTNAANYSSAHDGGIGVRVNCVGGDSRGRAVHDITASLSWLLGCTMGPSQVITSAGQKAAFAAGSGTDASKMWLDGCTSLSAETDCEAATTAVIYTRNLTRTANIDIGTITAY